MSYYARYLDKPCRNFCILGWTSFVDPLDGVEKVALSSFANQGTGVLAIVDPYHDKGEYLEFPLDNGGWAVYNYKNEALLIGTCAESGAVNRLDLKTRTWDKPLRIEGETYIWRFAMGGDDRLYGCTYPGCKLVRYDPEARILEDLGAVPPGTKNLYARLVHAAGPDHILVSVGEEEWGVYDYCITDGSMTRLGRKGDRVENTTADYFLIGNKDGTKQYYDIHTRRPVDSLPDEAREAFLPDPRVRGKKLPGMRRLSDGSLFGVFGQEYVFWPAGADTYTIRRIPVEPPATAIMTVAAGPDHTVWGSTCFGMTIFKYDTLAGKFWNSLTVSRGGGEVYGMVFQGRRLYMTAYAGGEHIVYDIDRPWNHHDNVNPHTLRPVGPDLIRPHGRSVTGPDGRIWTGWWAKYGEYGGGISRIDPKTEEVASFPDLVPGQSVASVAASAHGVYFATFGEANGLSAKKERFHLCALNTDGTVRRLVKLPEGVIPDMVACAGDTVALSTRDAVYLYDPELNPIKTLPIAVCTCLLTLDASKIAVFTADKKTHDFELYRMDAATGALEHLCKLPGFVHTATLLDGKIYFVNCDELCVIEKE